jgi:hypothetical protein
MAVAPDDPTFLQKLGGFTGRGGGLEKALAPFGGAGNLGLAMLANSGYSQTPRSFGQILGGSALQAQQSAVQQQQLAAEKQMDEIRKRYMEAQIATMQAKPATQDPASVKEYEYAKKNGYKGTFQEWVVAGGQSSRPSSVQEWDFFSTLPQEMQQRYLEMKRNPNMVVREVGGAPTVVAPSIGFGTKTTPLSTLQTEATAAQTLKGAEAEGGAVGKAKGEITGGVLTKGSNAGTVTAMLDIADPLIDAATGSLAGASRDKLAAVFGAAPQGAQAIAQLKVLQAGLMTNMPRMEGPQSDRDVQLYREAAGQIGDPMVPKEIKKAAVEAIRTIQERYKDRAASVGGASKAPKRIRVDAEGNVIGN